MSVSWRERIGLKDDEDDQGFLSPPVCQYIGKLKLKRDRETYGLLLVVYVCTVSWYSTVPVLSLRPICFT